MGRRRHAQFAAELDDLAREPGQLQSFAAFEIERHRGLHPGRGVADEVECPRQRIGGQRNPLGAADIDHFHNRGEEDRLYVGIVAQFAEYTRNPQVPRLIELLGMLQENPDILVVLNHPMWDLAGIGRARHVHVVSGFLAKLGMFIHAFELGGLRSWEENQAVLHLAEGWNQPVIAGGDRHGREPSAVVNLTNAGSLPEFIHDVRKPRRSHVLFMPQYREPFVMRMVQSILDVIREYRDYPMGSRRWDERVFHPDRNGVIRPLSTLWDKPPAFIELVFAALRTMEVTPVRRAMQFALGKPEHQMRFLSGNGQEVLS